MSTTKEFAGIFPYLVSPVDLSTGRPLENVLRELVEHLIRSGVHGLSPLGSTGEVTYLSFEQRQEIVRIVVDAAGGRVPVLPGVAAYSTGEAIRQAEAFVKLGADGLVTMLQLMFPLTRTAIEDYFRSIAAAVPVPLVLYTNPGLHGADLTPEIVLSLSQVSNIRYVKDASGNTGRILTILNKAENRVRVFSASAHIPVVVFRLGGVGWMAGLACVIPATCVRLYDLARQGRWDEAFELQKPAWQLNELFQKYSLAACIKTALQLQGFAVGDPIPPQEALGPKAVEEIRTVVEAL